MEDKKQLRVRFNLFDALILLLVVAVIGAALLLRSRATPGAPAPGVTRATTPMRYTVEITSAPKDMYETMRVGDGVYRSTDSTYLGTLVNVERRAHVENAYSPQTGTFVIYENDEWDDLYLTIENEGYVTAKEIVIGSLTIRVGEEIFVKGRGFAKSGYVTAVDTMAADVPEDTNVGAGELEAVYTIRFTDVRDFIAENFRVGERLYESVTGAQLGRIENVTVEPYFSMQLGPDGAAVSVEKAERYVVYVTLRGRAVGKTDGYYLDGGTELKIGAFATTDSRCVTRAFQYYELVSIGEVK